MTNDQKNLPLDERFRLAEQYSFDFPETTQPQPPKTFAEKKLCNKAGYCYCPKCNPR